MTLTQIALTDFSSLEAIMLLLSVACSSFAVLGHGPRVPYDKPPTPPGVTARDVQYTFNGKDYTGYVA